MRKLAIAIVALMMAGSTLGEEQLAVGAQAPPFSLTGAADGKIVEMKPADGFVKVVIFTCNSCPYAKAFEPRIIEIARKFSAQGVRFYLVNPNDTFSETLPEMKARADEKEYPFPYVKDADSSVARAYGARVTPHVFVVDGTGAVRYRGYVDDSAKPAERRVTGLTDAIVSLMDGREVANADTRAFGCTIKFKS